MTAPAGDSGSKLIGSGDRRSGDGHPSSAIGQLDRISAMRRHPPSARLSTLQLGCFAFVCVLACEASVPPPLALVAAPDSKLPAELIGEFRCKSGTYRSRLSIRADGRYRESTMWTRHGNHWEPIEVDEEPCDPLGRAAYRDGELVLDFQWASCKTLEDPITVAAHRRNWRLLEADANGFRDSDIRCERVR